jgi:CheY-like chemotaxis protein
MKILYVEDNDDNIYMLKNRLTRAGHTVVVANGHTGCCDGDLRAA